MPRRRLFGPRALLGALVVVSALARSLAGLRIDGLWVVPDEMIWGELGRSLWSDGSLRIFGGDQQVYGVVYPALAGAPLTLAGPEAGYDALKVVQGIVMSLTALPAYFWSRRLAGPWWALVAAALTLAVPDLIYSGLVMSEVVFYPAMLLAAWTMARALEQPTRTRQVLLVGAVVLAAATRLQALVLPLVLVTALLLLAAFERNVRRALRLWPSVAALVVLGVAWLVWRTAAEGAATGALGSYAPAADADYAFGDVARFVLYHAAALPLVTALFPFCAVVVLAVAAVRGRETSSAFAAYVATAVAMVVWLVAQAGAFASVYVDGLSTRYLLPLAPILFVGFAAWLSRGAPGSRLVALAVLGLLVSLPLRDLVVQAAAWQSPGVIALVWLRERAGEGDLELAVWGGAAVALALFAVLPARARIALPAIALAMLSFGSAAATREVVQNVASDQKNLVGGRPRWIDARATGPAAYLFVGESPLNIVWHQLFWNERLDRAYVLGGRGAGLPLATEVFPRPDGRLVPADGSVPSERYVVAADAVAVAGEQVDRVDLAVGDQSGLRLWRIDPPLRIRSLRTGVRPNGDMHEPGKMTVWDCAGGRLDLTLLPKAATRVDVRVNGQISQTLRFSGEEFVNASVSAPPGAAVCRFEVVPNGLLGSTVFDFVPAE